jgi:uncharacterized protein YcbK (DUF882 family)
MNLNRRQFITGTVGLVAAAMIPRVSVAAIVTEYKPLTFNNLHTGEKITIAHRNSLGYFQTALDQINHLFRDFRTGAIEPINPKLLDVIYQLDQNFNGNNVIDLISGYRSPETNGNLHAHSDGVAQNSFHMYGKAADIHFQGKEVGKMYKAALDLRAGGVGLYSKSNFVHVDVGPVRTWIGG